MKRGRPSERYNRDIEFAERVGRDILDIGWSEHARKLRADGSVMAAVLQDQKGVPLLRETSRSPRKNRCAGSLWKLRQIPMARPVNVDRLQSNIAWAVAHGLGARDLIPMLERLIAHASAGSESSRNRAVAAGWPRHCDGHVRARARGGAARTMPLPSAAHARDEDMSSPPACAARRGGTNTSEGHPTRPSLPAGHE